MSELCIGLCTTPDEPTAHHIADVLVTHRLAACVNILGSVTSVYQWQGEVCRESEHQMIIKTQRDKLDAVYAAIVEHHPYQEPEWLVLEVSGGSPGYLNWVKSCIK